MKRIICLLLALALVGGIVSSCADVTAITGSENAVDNTQDDHTDNSDNSGGGE